MIRRLPLRQIRWRGLWSLWAARSAAQGGVRCYRRELRSRNGLGADPRRSDPRVRNNGRLTCDTVAEAHRQEAARKAAQEAHQERRLRLAEEREHTVAPGLQAADRSPLRRAIYSRCGYGGEADLRVLSDAIAPPLALEEVTGEPDHATRGTGSELDALQAEQAHLGGRWRRSSHAEDHISLMSPGAADVPCLHAW
jgi:hypothetical protein